MRYFINVWLEGISPLVPFLVLVFNMKKVKSRKDLHLLLLIYSTLLVFCVLASVLSNEFNNIWVYNLICISSFLTISFYFFHILKTRLRRGIVKLLIPLFTIFFIVNTFLLGYNSLFNSYSFASLSIIISTFCILYYTEKLTLMEEDRLQDSYTFWVVTSFFTYYLGSFFIFLTYQQLSSRGRIIGTLWGLHNIIFFISCSISAFGLWRQFRLKSI